MARYLFQSSYTAEAIQGLIKDGGSKRREIAEQLAEKVGGRLEAYYFAFGENDVYGILDVPDNVTAAALALSVSASGMIKMKTVVLLTPEEVDEAVKRTVPFQAPGT
jgi:uncharacterized protein with GYD domain